MRAMAFTCVLLTLLAPTASGQAVCSLTDRTSLAGAPKIPKSALDLSNFAAGISADQRIGGSPRVGDAAVINDKITVTDSDDATLGLVLEGHAFVFNLKSAWAVETASGELVVVSKRPCDVVTATEFATAAMGPFAMVRVDSDELISAIGAGWMFGFRVKNTDKSINLGVAYTMHQDVKTLASGFEEGQPLPEGEETIRFRTENGTGIAFVISFGW